MVGCSDGFRIIALSTDAFQRMPRLSFLERECRRLSFFRQATYFAPNVIFNSVVCVSRFSIFQQQFLAIKRTGRERSSSRWVTAFALAVIGATRLQAELLPVTYDRRQFGEMLADAGGRVVGEKARGHLISSLETGLKGSDHHIAS